MIMTIWDFPLPLVLTTLQLFHLDTLTTKIWPHNRNTGPYILFIISLDQQQELVEEQLGWPG